MAKLTDKQKKKIISDYAMNTNIRETARINNTTDTTVRRLLKKNKDNVIEKVAQKQEENTKSTLEYMESQHNTKKELIKNILKAMNEKSLKVDMFTNIKDLATAYGIIIDKEIKIIELDLKRKELKLKDKEIETTKRIYIVDDLPNE